MILVTGGAGFIGSNFVLQWLAETGEGVVNLDKLTYAADPANLAGLADDARHVFVQGDIGDQALVSALLLRHRPRAVVHCAAETHVDRSIAGARAFVTTNVVGTFQLLEAVRAHWTELPVDERAAEVYGAQAEGALPVGEGQVLAPGNPYSASKAAADHMVLAWHNTWGLPALITRSCNNYGPHQHPEKLIPQMIAGALAAAPLPVYGDGRQRRDWLHVSDHCRALGRVLDRGRVGAIYNIAGGCEQTNLDVVRAVCALLDERAPRADGHPYARQIAHVTDRPGHDRRYAIDATRIGRELGWQPREGFAGGLRGTVAWYLAHPERLRAAQERAA